tara:strand:- start:627 stop:1766 length:1140 start_codon:yes stop_codon:yes gene_type:complete
MNKIIIICLLFSVNSFSQGLISSSDFYKKGNFIEITRSAKPIKKSLYSYTAWTHNQEGNTCVTHSIAQAMTILYSIRNNSFDREMNTFKSFSPYFVYINISNDLNSGMMATDGLDYVMKFGNPLISYVEFDEFYPFSDNIISKSKLNSLQLKKAKENAKKFKLKNYKKLINIDGVKQSISQNYPVLYCTSYIPPSISELYNCETEFCFWDPDPKEKLDPESRGMGHAMLIVGYDDRKKAVQVLNSWGADFGNDGFFWIPYEDVFTGMLYIDDKSIDLGSGHIFYNNSNKIEKLTTSEVNDLVNSLESEYDIKIPRGNGFGNEAYSLQGISFDESIFWEEKQYIPQSQRKGSKASILEENPDYKDSDWFMKFDDLLKDSE